MKALIPVIVLALLGGGVKAWAYMHTEKYLKRRRGES